MTNDTALWTWSLCLAADWLARRAGDPTVAAPLLAVMQTEWAREPVRLSTTPFHQRAWQSYVIGAEAFHDPALARGLAAAGCQRLILFHEWVHCLPGLVLWSANRNPKTMARTTRQLEAPYWQTGRTAVPADQVLYALFI